MGHGFLHTSIQVACLSFAKTIEVPERIFEISSCSSSARLTFWRVVVRKPLQSCRHRRARHVPAELQITVSFCKSVDVPVARLAMDDAHHGRHSVAVGYNTGHHGQYSSLFFTGSRAGVPTTLPPPRFLIGESFKGLQVLAAALDKERQAFYGVQFAGVITLSALLQVSPGMLPPNQSLRC
jgi:hypothetical protein